MRIGCVAVCVGILIWSGESPAQSDSAEVFDEWSIKDVWHQAKLRGVSFRAIGQEPGWLLEITNGTEIFLSTNYGEIKNSYPYVEPQVYQEERRTRYVLDTHEIVVEIRGEPCADVMSGEQFSVTVTITTKERILEGCGKALH